MSAVFTQTEGAEAESHDFGQGGLPGLPPGAIPGADYVIGGQIAAGDDGGYMLTVRLEAGGTREEVASGTVAWDLEEGLKLSTAAAAELLMPLMSKIRQFEKRKRDTMTAVAIWPNRGLQVIPDPPVVNPGASSEVTIRLKDCDGVPLRNRIVAPTAVGGLLIPPEVPVTDANGEMQASFSLAHRFDSLAKKDAKRGTVFAEYHYVPPYSARDESGANASAVVVSGNHFVWVKIRKRITKRSSSERNYQGDWHSHSYSQGSNNEVIDVEVTMMPDFESVIIDRELDMATRRRVPRRYTYTLAENDPVEINKQFFNTSFSNYERTTEVGYVQRTITKSGSGYGKFTIDNVGASALTLRVDPSGQVTDVSLPGVGLMLNYVLNTACTKTQRDKTEDCGSREEYTRLFSMTPGQEDSEGDCSVPKEQTAIRVLGECRWEQSDENSFEEHVFEWTVQMLGRKS